MTTDEHEHVHCAIDPDHPGMTTPFYDLAGNRVGDPVPVESLSRTAFDRPVVYSPLPEDQGITFTFPLPADTAAKTIDAAHLSRQREFSARTFGPGARTAGVIDHISKELREIAAAPDDVTEWADLIILAFDGAMRAGHDPQVIIDAIKAKQTINESRTWPDWRTQDPGKAIEHVREETDPDQCPRGSAHRWAFDGDDPYVLCVCGQRRDALTGRVIVIGGDQ